MKETLALFDRIERLPVPVVAAIHGYCLGGGLELALACDWRIADREEGTRLGFPEVKLGIFPGLNGTVRSIQLAGPMDAMTAMLTGRMLRPGAAKAIGLIDQLVPTPPQSPLGGAQSGAAKAPLQGRAVVEEADAQAAGARAARQADARQDRGEGARGALPGAVPPHRPVRAAMATTPFACALAETEMFTPLMASETSRNLRRVFKLSEMLKDEAPQERLQAAPGACDRRRHHGRRHRRLVRQPGHAGEPSGPRRGADREGARPRQEAVQAAAPQTPIAIETAMARLLADPTGKHIKHADVVIEAIVEKLDVKQSLFKKLEKEVKPGAVLATNTSSLRLEDIAKPLSDPGRLVGLHFFNPVAQLPLVEVVRGEQTREEEVRKACAFVTAINKLPLIVKSCAGFLVNRVLAPYMMEAVRRYQQGEPREKIDQAALKFGMPMGPLELMDMVGLDIANHVGEELDLAPGRRQSRWRRWSSRASSARRPARASMCGSRASRSARKRLTTRPSLNGSAASWCKPMLDEAERALADHVVANADHVDAGVIFGTGFAPFRGGPLHYRRQAAQAAATAAAA